MTHGLLRVTLMLGTVSVSIGAVAWTAAVPRRTATMTQSEGRPECPHDTVVWRDSNGVDHTFDQIPLSGEISGIPEFHDCQRFINKKGGYESLYAIYAAFHLESLPCGLSRCGVGTATAVGIPAATILSYGGNYPSLGIRNGFNCLYLWNPPDWKAALIPQAANPDCRYKRTVEPLPPEAVPLTVRVISNAAFPPFRDAEYPPVARWDWDPASSQQFIGIRCGIAWCEIGGPSTGSGLGYPPAVTFDPVPGLMPSTAATNAVTQVKGWFDAQWLAKRMDGTGNLKVLPTVNRGFIVPNPVLGDVQQSHLEGHWVHAATAVLDADYQSTVHFVKGENKIYLCHGPGCGVSSDDVKCPEGSVNTLWWARITVPGSRPVYRCVVYRSYPSGLTVPGTVRWRWQAEDETTWIKCPSGCCELK